jgi:hypothetical protein
VYRTCQGAFLPGVVVHQGKRLHASGAWRWVDLGGGQADDVIGEAEPRPIISRFHHPSGIVLADLHRPGSEDGATEVNAYAQATSELLHILDTSGRPHCFDRLDLLGVGLDPSVQNQETEQLAHGDPEHTLVWVQLGVGCSQPVKD